MMIALTAFGAALGLAGTVAAEPRLAADRGDLRRQLEDLKRRSHELDEKIRRIEAELARNEPPPPVAPRAIAPAAPNCRLPYFLDSTGIRHVREECLEPAGQPSCDPPYNLDEHGVRRFRPACASGAIVPANRGNE